MKKVLVIFLSLLVLLIAKAFSFDLNNIFNAYKNKSIKMCFTQLSINGMTGQSIKRVGVMTIEAQRMMEFYYPHEKIIIDNFKVTDIRGNKEYIYRLKGFNRVLFFMFLGKKNINELFSERKVDNSTYQLAPKYQSNIASIFVYFHKNRVKKLKIVDIYANKTIYTFYDFPCKRAQRGN